MTRIHLIYARSNNGVIGRDNQLPWRLPEDLAHFKRVTMGSPIIMGRKTWDSIGRPLPGRANIVITRNPQWQAAGAVRAASLEQALALIGDAPQAFVIGGAELYALALPVAHRAYVTEIDVHVDGGDAFAPTLGREWQEISRETHTQTPGPNYSFVVYERQPTSN